MPNPTLSANGSVIIPLLSGRIYTIGVGGDFGGGSLAANLLLDDNTPVPVTGFPIIAPADKTFTGTTTRLQLTLSGATSPALTYAVTLANGNSPESIGAATPASVEAQIDGRENYTRYPKRRIAFLGDSITGWWSNLGLGVGASSLGGWGGFAQAMTGFGFDVVSSSSGFNFATGGFTLTQIQTTWLPEVLTSDADVCFLLGGTNGSGETAADKFGKWLEIIQALDAANILPIASTVIPAGDIRTSEYQAVINDFNNRIRVYCESNNILLCDWHDSLCDQSTEELSVDYSGDKVHPNYTGSMPMASELAKVLGPITTPLNRVPSISDVKWLSANPQLAGDASGLPTSWSRTLVGTGTMTPTKVARSDGKLGTILQCVVAGGGDKTDGVTVNVPNATTGFADNDIVRGIFEIEFLESGWEAWTIGTTLTIVGGTHNAYRAYHPNVGSTASIAALTAKMQRPIAVENRSIIFETPDMSTGVGATYITLGFLFRGAGTFRILRGGIYKT